MSDSGTEIVDGGGDGWLEYLVLRDRSEDREETVDAGGLFIMIGAAPADRLAATGVQRDAQGFIVTGTGSCAGPRLAAGAPTILLETSMPGVFAAGDVRHGAGRRVASAVGEGAVAIQLLHQFFAPSSDSHEAVRAEPLTVLDRPFFGKVWAWLRILTRQGISGSDTASGTPSPRSCRRRPRTVG